MLHLTEGDRATLLRWARSPTCGQALAQRAQIVLACEQAPSDTAVAQRLGISRDMVGKWRSRFLAEGPQGLNGRRRPGRPPTVGDDTVVQVLVRLLGAPPSGRTEWSTRAMAAETGLSQTTVGRIWRAHRLHLRAGQVRPGDGRTPALSTEIRDVAGLFVAPPARVLAVVADEHAPPVRQHRNGTNAPPQPVNLPFAEARNLLAVADAFALVRGGANAYDPGSESPLGDFLRRLERSVPSGLDVHLLVDGAPNSPTRDVIEAWAREHPRFHRYPVPDGSSWLDEAEGLLANMSLLGHENVTGFETSLPGLRDAIRTWCEAWTPHTGPFAWLRGDSAEPRSGQGDRTGPDVHDSPGEASGVGPGISCLADALVRLVHEALLTSRFPSGERVKEAPLAARLGVSRRQVRTALRVLTEEGILDRLPGEGAAVPHVDVTAILDLYASRAMLGTVLMRRGAMMHRSALQSVDTAVAEVWAAARHHDSGKIIEADLSFQDEIARVAGLPQTSLCFQRLTMRVRMFVAILQLDFDPAAEHIAREDAKIFEAIRSGDGDAAARLWRLKVERSVRYMVAKVPQGHFDSHLWTAIAGKPTRRPRRSRQARHPRR